MGQHVLHVQADKRINKYLVCHFQVSYHTISVTIQAHTTFGNHNPWWSLPDRQDGNRTIMYDLGGDTEGPEFQEDQVPPNAGQLVEMRVMACAQDRRLRWEANQLF